MASRLLGRQQERRAEEGHRDTIPIDAPVDLPYDHPVATLGPGDLFGEMTCISLYPRSATVRAATDCVMFEMLRNVLDIIQRNKTLKAQMDAKYRQRALDDHLRSVPMFASLSQEFIDVLRNKVELVRYTKGDVICSQGDVADSFYLIRLGFVKVSEPHPGGELVLAYLGRGGYFGEIGLLGGGTRTATCTALDHVELVRIHAEEFHQMVQAVPGRSRKPGNVGPRASGAESATAGHRRQHVPLDSFLTQGLMEAQSLLMMDLERCTRCDACVRACADAHDGVTRLIREGQRFDKYLVATSCRQCRDPLCMVGCPVGSIRRRNSLEVIIENWCIGCGLCAKNCPYGNINMHPFTVMENDPHEPGPPDGRRSSKKPLPAICAPIWPSPAASTPARTTPRIAWSRTNFSVVGLAGRLTRPSEMQDRSTDTPPLGDRDRRARGHRHRRVHSVCGRNAQRTARRKRAGLTFGIAGYAMMLYAGLLGARKQVPTWRIGRAQTWMRGHLWLGLLSLLLILFHARIRFSRTADAVLMLLFFIVIGSGILGAAIQHYVPSFMTSRVPMETIYEEIPHVRAQLREEADQLAAAICGPVRWRKTRASPDRVSRDRA